MSADEAVPQFHDKESEVRYWKSRYYDLQDTLKETEASLHEFMDSSKELEKEMDREISAANSKSNELQVRCEKLKGDVDEWKSKYQRALTDHNKTLAELNRELSTLRESHNIYKNQMRDLELNNDELENAERMVASSLNDMESRYNKAIERTALLEEELVEKSRLEEENQRLKDELQEVNEELAVLRESMGSARLHSRTTTPAVATSSTGRSSVDEMHLSDLTNRQRPLSRASARPASRGSGMKTSPPLPRATLPSIASSSRLKSLSSSRMGHSRVEARDGRASVDDLQPSGMTSSPSTNAVRARQSVGPSSFRTSTRAPRHTSTPASMRTQPTASKAMIGDMFQRMRALEKRLADTRNGVAPDVQSAIPRPSSRLGSSIGPGNTSVNLTPRRSIDMRREENGTPSSIPVPLNKSTSRRPTSRLSHAAGLDSGHISSSHIPSSLRCQTPTMESSTATLDFLDQDPSKLKRRSHLAMSTSTTSAPLAPTATSAAAMYHSSQNRPRGSTLSLGLARGESLRKSANPGTGRPAPPVSWKPGQTIRPRSGSIES